MSSPNEPPKEPPKQPNNKCKKCNRKLTLMAIQTGKCRCNNIYCKAHLNDHSCSFNYLEQSQNMIEKNNPTVIPAKV